jgi:hypothetical protein
MPATVQNVKVECPAGSKPGLPIAIGLPGGAVITLATPVGAKAGSILLVQVATTTVATILEIDGRKSGAESFPADGGKGGAAKGTPDGGNAGEGAAQGTPDPSKQPIQPKPESGAVELRERWRNHLAQMPQVVRWSFYGTVFGVFCTALMLLALACIYIFLNIFDKTTPSWLSNFAAWTFVTVLMIALWGSFIFLALYTSHIFYRWLQGNPAEDFVQFKIPKFLQIPFYVVGVSTFLACFTIFATCGVYLSFAAMSSKPGEWFHSVLKDTLLVTCLIALWGPFLFFILLASHSVVVYVRATGYSNHDKLDGEEEEEGERPKEKKKGLDYVIAYATHIGQWPPSLRVVFFITGLGFYFSTMALLTCLGLFASHKAFHDNTPSWMQSIILETFNVAILVALWGAIVFVALWASHGFNTFIARQQLRSRSNNANGRRGKWAKGQQEYNGRRGNFDSLILYFHVFSSCAVGTFGVAAISILGVFGIHVTYSLHACGTEACSPPDWLVTFLTKTIRE